ncbi:MAG: LOG family protein [Actinomycetota bacterium]
MTDRVLGPGGRGIVVATADPEEALDDLHRLRSSGVPATTPLEAGLRRPGPFEEARDAVRFWSTATRRVAIAADGNEQWVAGPGSEAALLGREPVDPDAHDPLPRVTVFGGAWVDEEEPEHREALRFGRLAAEAGFGIANGGYGGIMDAVSRGATEAGGTVLGVTIGSFSEQVPVNRWLTHEVEARDLFARLPLICDAEAWVAFPGGVGTLAEVALCWNLVQTGSIEARPLVIVGERWDRALASFRELLLAEGVHFDLIRPAASADAALEIVRDAG